ncbi:MAG: hypothetical protein MI923_13080 [Phycisphaerales bacterium]|nr:hypothetical protein [Phycisphaerales bacterium]
MSKKPKTTTEEENEKESEKEPEEPAASKRGRSAKEPPPPKLWRIEGRSPEGLKVTLGRFITKEEAEVELHRLRDDGFYEKLRLSESAI